ncbi:anti-sigma factor [Bacteroidia bacterium]|nr:anti-sigma factor [Bacteroidia bacterium]
MIEYIKEFDTIEDFVLDNRFSELVKKNDRNEINKMLELYPEKQDIMDSAIVLLQHLKIETPSIPDEQVEKDWSDFLKQVNEKKSSRKNKHFYLWTSVSTVAACAAAIFLIFINPSPNNRTDDKEHLLTLLESVDANTNKSEVQVIAGQSQTNIDNNETIIQTEDGNLIVGEDRKFESSEIKTEYLTVVVPKGRRTTLKLSDGSTVWVNSGTKLVYPKTFNGKTREIMVDGEAYLDVAKDENWPFMVHTKGFDIAVLGTRFNVNAYSSDQENSVVLVEGSVEITAESSKGKLIPNQGFFAANGDFSIKNVDVYPHVCWKDGVMKLDGESLNIILKKLSRHYGIDIQFNEKYANEKYKGKIDLSESIETVLNNISVSTPIRYTRNEDVIIIN